MSPQFRIIWPKDGEKGKNKRGFLRGLNDILTGRGPDMFLQTPRERKAASIPREVCGNWDSYHDQDAHVAEQFQHNGFWNTSRGVHRYDPYSRRYVEWFIPTDWHQNGGDPYTDESYYPMFTRKEWHRMNRSLSRGKQVDPRKMGKDWSAFGPKRFRPEHNQFWADVHRIGYLKRQQLNLAIPYSNLRLGQISHTDLIRWMNQEGLF
ncbi:hypothetical protein F5884DRAFT_499783 [Xylogone sp. PMI_703]|nr:hypothetical protein F5884DRAFT_499783 [Xylogone sp. PMI_703]